MFVCFLLLSLGLISGGARSDDAEHLLLHRLFAACDIRDELFRCASGRIHLLPEMRMTAEAERGVLATVSSFDGTLDFVVAPDGWFYHVRGERIVATAPKFESTRDREDVEVLNTAYGTRRIDHVSKRVSVHDSQFKEGQLPYDVFLPFDLFGKYQGQGVPEWIDERYLSRCEFETPADRNVIVETRAIVGSGTIMHKLRFCQLHGFGSDWKQYIYLDNETKRESSVYEVEVTGWTKYGTFDVPNAGRLLRRTYLSDGRYDVTELRQVVEVLEFPAIPRLPGANAHERQSFERVSLDDTIAPQATNARELRLRTSLDAVSAALAMHEIPKNLPQIAPWIVDRQFRMVVGITSLFLALMAIGIAHLRSPIVVRTLWATFVACSIVVLLGTGFGLGSRPLWKNIKIPYDRTYENRCGPESLYMALALLGRSDHLSEIVDLVTVDDEQGASVRSLALALGHLQGIEFEVRQNPTGEVRLGASLGSQVAEIVHLTDQHFVTRIDAGGGWSYVLDPQRPLFVMKTNTLAAYSSGWSIIIRNGS